MQPLQQMPVQLLPQPGRLPVSQPPPARHTRAASHLTRQHLPGNARAEHEENAGERGAVQNARPPTTRFRRLRGKQGLDDGPEIIGNKR
jgi:hypothetical protein